jgi:signal transduction histidine kinase
MSDLPSPQRTHASSVDELERLRAEHAATVQALQNAIRDTSRLARMLAILNEAGPLDRVLDHVLATLSELFMSDVVVLLESPGDGSFAPLAAIGLPAGMEKRVAFSSEISYTTAALRKCEPTAATNARTDSRVDAYLRELGVEAAVWLPVKGDAANCRGVLVLARCRALPFIQSDVDLLMTLAYRIGVLVERAHAEDERRKLEARLRQAEKTESLGRMASAIAHHFNNMLGAVVSSLDLAMDELSQNLEVLEDLEIARESALRAAKTSELMLAYLGQSVRKTETVDLTEVLREARPELEASVRAGVKLTFDLRDSGLIVLVSPEQIRQVLTNLITNAWESMSATPGEIQVSVRAVSGARMPKTYLPTDWTPRSASYVCLEVRDTGCGMTADTLEKIFDPFFTTKFVGRGLGLPVVLGTVRAYDGMVSVESVIGRGSTFRVFLPHAPLSLMASRTPKPNGVAVGVAAQPGLILLAEDEERLLRNTERMLVRLGYDVLSATDGLAAIDKFRRRAREVRLAVLDVAMPHMDGWATLAALRAVRPDLPVILVSGYNQADVLRGQPPQHGLTFLHKPYTLAELCRMVAKSLESGAASARPPVA